MSLSSRPSKIQSPNKSRFNFDYSDEVVQDKLQQEPDPKDRVAAMYPQYDIVRELCAGEAFGEIALINNARRTASIICKEETTFAVLSKQSYDKILSQYHQAEQEKNISFLKEFTIFNQLESWINKNSREIKLYILKEIKLSLFILLEMERQNLKMKIFLFVLKVSQSCVKVDGIKNNEQQGDPEYEKMMNNYNLKWKGQQQKDSTKRIKIAILGKSNYFGQEEILSNIPRLYRAEVCSTTAIIYTLPKQKFLGTVKLFSYSMDTMQKELSKRATWRINQLEKNLTTNKKIDVEAEKAQKEIVKLEFAEYTLKEKPDIASQFIVSDLDTIQKEHLAQDFYKHGIIRSEKDANKINEDIINSLKGKKKQKQKQIDPKAKLFKLTLENTLFQEESDKNKIKRIMSPKQSKSLLAIPSQKHINTNINGKERQEIVKELLHAQDMKSLVLIENEKQGNHSNLNKIKSLSQLPLDCISPYSLNASTNMGDHSGGSPNKQYKSMILINNIHHDQLQSSSNIQNIQSVTDILKPKKGSLVSKYIQYDALTPQNVGLIKEEMDPDYLSLNGQSEQQIDFESNAFQKSKVKRIQSANPKIGGINMQNYHKYVIFPANQNSKLQEKKKIKPHSSTNLNNTIQQNLIDVKEELKRPPSIKIIQEENESPMRVQKQEYINKHRIIHPQNTSTQFIHKNGIVKENNKYILQSPQSKQSLQNIYNQPEIPIIISTSSASPERRQSTLNEYDSPEKVSIIPYNQSQNKDSKYMIKQNNQNKQNQNLLNSSTNTIKVPANQMDLINLNIISENNLTIKNKMNKNGIKSKSICSFEMPKAHLMMNHQHKNHIFAQHVYEQDQMQIQNQSTNIELSQTVNDDKIQEMHAKDFNNENHLLQVHHNSFQLETDSQRQLQDQKNQLHPLFNKDYSSFKGKSKLNQFEITPGFSSYHPTTENLQDPEQKITKVKNRPQSSLIGTYTQQQLSMMNLNSPARQQQGQSLSNLCSPINVKEGSNNFIPNSSNNSRLKFSILHSPQSKQMDETKTDNQQNFPNYGFSQTYASANLTHLFANQTQLQNNQTHNSTQINLNGFSQMNFQQLHPNRSHIIISQMNNTTQIQRPRSYKKENKSVDKQESKNIHMDKLRFLKKDLDIKDPFKNNNKQFKKLMAFTNQFQQNQIPTSPKGSQTYLKPQQN